MFSSASVPSCLVRSHPRVLGTAPWLHLRRFTGAPFTSQPLRLLAVAAGLLGDELNECLRFLVPRHKYKDGARSLLKAGRGMAHGRVGMEGKRGRCTLD